jgi:O-antigen/teichoic acid export membrane protein
LPERFLTGFRRIYSSDFVRHGLIIFAASMIVNVFGYLYHSLNSRRLGVEGYGVLSALNAAYMISLFVPAILSTVVVKYAAEFRALEDAEHLSALGRAVTKYVGAAAVAAIVLGSLLVLPAGRFLHIADAWSIELIALVIGLSLLLNVLRGVLQGVENFRGFALSTMLESLLKTVLGVGLVYAGYGVVGALGGWLTGTIVALAFTLWTVLWPHRNRARVPLHLDVRRLVLTSANVALSILLITSLGYSDVLLVKHYSDATTAGLYGALSLSGKMLFFLVAFVPTVVLPKASRRAAGGASPLPLLLLAVGSVILLAGSGLFLYFAFPSRVVTLLAGKAFASAAPLVFPYGIATVFLAILNAVVFYKMAIHRFDFLVPLTLVAVAEVAGIALRHDSLAHVIEVLIVANGVALVAALYRVNVPLDSRKAAPASGAAA